MSDIDFRLPVWPFVLIGVVFIALAAAFAVWARRARGGWRWIGWGLAALFAAMGAAAFLVSALLAWD